MAAGSEATDTSYIVNDYDDANEEHGQSNSGRMINRATGKLETYLDEKVDIPDADNVSIRLLSNIGHSKVSPARCSL